MSNALADRITNELRVPLVQPISDSWRVTNMQILEFGPRHRITNRQGEEVEVSDVQLHVQCRLRLVDGTSIIFGRDDLYHPAERAVSPDDFDYDKHQSVLDVRQRQWFDLPQRLCLSPPNPDNAPHTIGACTNHENAIPNARSRGINPRDHPPESLRQSPLAADR